MPVCITFPLSRIDITMGIMPIGSIIAKSTIKALKNWTQLKVSKNSITNSS